jgi:hypothetical protein
MIWRKNCFVSGLLLLLAWPASALEMRVQYPALERLLGQQLFTQDGRRYVQGTDDRKCNYAYLEKPKIGEWNGRLVIRARFIGKAALGMFGKCVGIGDSFDLTLVGTPVYQSGVITLKDVQASTNGHDTMYSRRVMKGLQQALTKDIGYPAESDAKKILEQSREGQPFQQSLSNFEISAVRATPNALVLVLDFVLTVK